MKRVRCVIPLLALALLLPARAAAEAPQIYVGSGQGYSVAFKVEAGRTSVLALDAPIYCTELRERFPATMSMFQGPTLMRAGRHGLEAPLRPNGGPSSYVGAAFDGVALSGTFVLDLTEESIHCQTVGFTAARPEVHFKALRYEPVGSGATLPPRKDEIPIYYGSEGGTEVLLETTSGSVVFRGAAPAKCPVAGRRPAAAQLPLFGDVTEAESGEGSFHRTFKRRGKSWKESRSVSGVVGDEEIAGFYTRSTVTWLAKDSPRRCTTGALPFRAVRYLPAAGS
jgi:hypothetical protein